MGMSLGMYSNNNDWKALFTGVSGGGGGIRTLGGLSPSLVFKTSAFDHSATPPLYGGESYYNLCHSQQAIEHK